MTVRGSADTGAREPHVPDLAFIRGRMPDRADRHTYLVHALRFFEDVLDYADALAAGVGVPPDEAAPGARCDKCNIRTSEPRIETVDGRGPGWKCASCGWWHWLAGVGEARPAEPQEPPT